MSLYQQVLQALGQLGAEEKLKDASVAKFSLDKLEIIVTNAGDIVIVNAISQGQVNSVQIKSGDDVANKLKEAIHPNNKTPIVVQQGDSRREPREPHPHQHQQQREKELATNTGAEVPFPGRAPEYPSAAHARRPNDMPDFDDEYDLQRQAHGSNPLTNPFPNLGRDDLNPPITFPGPSFGGAPGGGGMFPLLGGMRSNRNRAPPGARFDDPYDPSLGAFDGVPGGPGGLGGIGGGGPPGGFGGGGGFGGSGGFGGGANGPNFL